MSFPLTISCVILWSLAVASGQQQPIDTQRSTITIHVGKAGLLSVAGHEHWIEAPITSGSLNNSAPASVEFRVRAATLAVRPDPKVDAKTQAEIQKDMQEKVLERDKYPEIVFRSSPAEKRPDGQWSVDGLLTLHGITKEVRVLAMSRDDAYTGRTTLKQTDFGITPITAVGGAVKVKNELEVEFRVFVRKP
jgi:polyisoprenoid-binding protein YceI